MSTDSLAAIDLLMLSTDCSLLKAGPSDAKQRLFDYGNLVHAIDVLVLARNVAPSVTSISDRVTVHAIAGTTSALRFIQAFRHGRKIGMSTHIDAVVTQDCVFTGPLGLLLARTLDAKLLVSVYGTNVFDPYWRRASRLNRILAPIGMAVLRRADAIQTDGIETLSSLRQHIGNHAYFKPMVPSDIDRFSRLTPGPLAAGPRILFVGRLTRQKNIPLLVRVLATLHYQQPTLSATIVGTGPLESYLRTQVESRRLARVEVHSSLTRDEMLAAFAAHHVLLCTSYYEGFPRAFMEAAASAMPIVTTRVSGVSSVVQHLKTGYVLEQGDYNGLLAALDQLLGDERLRRNMSQAIRQRFCTRYSYPTTVRAQRNVLTALFAGPT